MVAKSVVEAGGSIWQRVSSLSAASSGSDATTWARAADVYQPFLPLALAVTKIRVVGTAGPVSLSSKTSSRSFSATYRRLVVGFTANARIPHNAGKLPSGLFVAPSIA